jgi:methyl-accepting chemotaxis protein
MKRFNDYRISTKLGVVFTLVIAIGISGYGIALRATLTYMNGVETDGLVAHEAVAMAKNASIDYHRMSQSTVDYVNTGEKVYLNDRLAVDPRADADYNGLKLLLLKLPQHNALVAQWQTTKDQDDLAMAPIEDRMLSMVANGRRSEAQSEYELNFVPALDNFTKDIDGLGDAVNAYSVIMDKKLAAEAHWSIVTSGVLQAAAVLLCIVLATMLSRSISRKLAMLLKAAQGLALGDINQRIDAVGADEIGRLAEAFKDLIAYQVEMARVAASIARGDLTQNVTPKGSADVLGSAIYGMVTNLSSLISSVVQNAETIADTSTALSEATGKVQRATDCIAQISRDVASASEQSARGASEVARGCAQQTEFVSASNDQIHALTIAVQGVATDAREARDSADVAAQVAQDGVVTVQETVSGMNGVRQAVVQAAGVMNELKTVSGQIGSIVETVNEIASQTNLLALNAAIEAARAGEAGRGFAVVADEVRKLAERSTRATNEIGSLVLRVQGQTEQAVAAMDAGSREAEGGTAMAEKAGAALLRIKEVVQNVTVRVQAITTSATGMAASASDVSRSMSEVTSIIELNSAAAEEMSASSEEVSASVQTVASSTEEQTTSVQELVASTERLARVADILNAAIREFKILPADADSPETSVPANTRLFAKAA